MAAADLRVPRVGSGSFFFDFALIDAAAAPAAIAVEYSVDGQSWSACSEGPDSCGLTGLATADGSGARQVFVWDSGADVGADVFPQVRVRVRPVNGLAAESAPFMVDNGPFDSDAQITRRPYLQSMTGSSVMIIWKTDNRRPSVVEFGADLALGQSEAVAGTRTTHEITLTNLTPGTEYCYRIAGVNGPATERFCFKTAPAQSDADFSFLAIGDSGTGSAEQLAIAQRMSREQGIDLMLHTGDVIYPSGERRHYQERFFDPYAPILSRVPIFPAIGNHDLITLGIPYKEAFYLPANNSRDTELYYSFEFGDAKFIVLDTTIFGHIPVGKHMTWLRSELASNTRRWLIMFFHIPLYSSGRHGNDRILELILGPLIERHKVDLVLTGHDHHYERFQPIKKFSSDPSFPGTVHVLTGGGGRGLYSTGQQSETVYAESAFHYTRFDVSANSIRGRAVRIDGRVIDDFVIAK